MYKPTKGPQAVDCGLTQRVANKGSSCRLPTTVHGPRPSYDVTSKTKFEVKHQDEPTPSNPVAQHKNLAGMEHSGRDSGRRALGRKRGG